jgi:hypothetical protein
MRLATVRLPPFPGDLTSTGHPHGAVRASREMLWSAGFGGRRAHRPGRRTGLFSTLLGTTVAKKSTMMETAAQLVTWCGRP